MRSRNTPNNGFFLAGWAVSRAIICNRWMLMLMPGGGGGLPYETDGNARRLA